MPVNVIRYSLLSTVSLSPSAYRNIFSFEGSLKGVYPLLLKLIRIINLTYVDALSTD
jgi:hypothetical protein